MTRTTIHELAIYQQRAMETEADQTVILHRFLDMGKSEQLRATRLSNGIRGLSDEIGELNSALKKWLEYDQPLDRENIIEEVGDCLWRLAQIAKSCNFDLEEAANANIHKLQKVRYKDGYSDEAAAEENRNREAESAEMKPEVHQAGWAEPPESDGMGTVSEIPTVPVQDQKSMHQDVVDKYGRLRDFVEILLKELDEN
jgi:NTP pyrophosphatase (non-canonical NTP hydrolase)